VTATFYAFTPGKPHPRRHHHRRAVSKRVHPFGDVSTDATRDASAANALRVREPPRDAESRIRNHHRTRTRTLFFSFRAHRAHRRYTPLYTTIIFTRAFAPIVMKPSFCGKRVDHECASMQRARDTHRRGSTERATRKHRGRSVVRDDVRDGFDDDGFGGGDDATRG